MNSGQIQEIDLDSLPSLDCISFNSTLMIFNSFHVIQIVITKAKTPAKLMTVATCHIARISYCIAMSLLIRKIAHYLAQKAASDPEAREKMLKVARGAVGGAKKIAKENDSAYAAGRALRRALNKSQNDR